jgi:hypothetical protein
MANHVFMMVSSHSTYHDSIPILKMPLHRIVGGMLLWRTKVCRFFKPFTSIILKDSLAIDRCVQLDTARG